MRGRGASTGTFVVLVTSLAGLLAGCVATAPVPPPRGILVSGPPPAILREDRPPAPGPQATWLAGYWHWTGMQYSWIPGHWEAAPPVGATWHAPAYVQNNGAYFYEAAGWSAGQSGQSGQSGAPLPPAATTPPPNREAFH